MLESVVCMGVLTSFGRIKKYTRRLRQTDDVQSGILQSRQIIHCSLTEAVSVSAPYFLVFAKAQSKAKSEAIWQHSASPKSYQSIHFHWHDQNDQI